ncbi:MAG TPA: SGNH/GDSL hydrolase family protein [Nocardioidaceae bacterium]|nr:SGNH/GDSL hydrolase family protein [Nocardioidaceae bacterium]
MALSKKLLAVAPPALLALLAVQGMQVRRTALRLPEALGPERDYAGADGEPLNLYVIGDSVAAAVGLDDHGTSVAGRLSELLSRTRPVRMRVLAVSGFNAVEATDHVAGQLGDADVVIVSIGVNDTKDLHSRRRWRGDLTRLLESVTSQAPDARVVLIGIPPMEVFPALPVPLGLALGLRSRQMDFIGRQVADRFPGVRRLELPRGGFEVVDDPFARDGFHPSASSHAVFAARIHALLEEPAHV